MNIMKISSVITYIDCGYSRRATRKLVMLSQGQFSEEMLQGILQAVNLDEPRPPARK